MDVMDEKDPFKVPTSTASRKKSHQLEIAPAILRESRLAAGKVRTKTQCFNTNVIAGEALRAYYTSGIPWCLLRSDVS
jgi:hypothetical protein